MDADHSFAGKLEAIRNAVGPSPWYWQTFPHITGASGAQYGWKFHGTEGEHAYLTTLARFASSDNPILALGSMCRPFVIPPHFLGIWFPHQGLMNVRCWNPDELSAFELSQLPHKSKWANKYYYTEGDTIARAWIDAGLPTGRHKLEVPETLSNLEETLMVSVSSPWATAEDLGCSVFDVRWRERYIDVYPQEWFNHGNVDFGYQWITRVTRDPQTGRFIGDGIRIGSFELTDDGCHLERWLKMSA